MTRLLTRKDVAVMLGVSVNVVRRNERRIGLDRCKARVNARLIFYRERDALTALQRAGLIPLP